MRTVEIGEIRTSQLGFGCGSVMGRVGRRDSLRAMHAAWDAGVTLFDTARSYGYGEAEGLLGEFLLGKRVQATVVTKFGILPAPPSRLKHIAKPLVRRALSILPQARELVRRKLAAEFLPQHFDVATLRTSLDQSLRMLKTDYVDVLLAHEAPLSVMAQDDLVAELEALLRAGKARRIGISCSPEVAAAAMHNALKSWRAFQFAANIFQTHMVEGNAERRLLRMANHPFGGAPGIRFVTDKLSVMHQDKTVEAELRDKLKGQDDHVLPELAFAVALQKADVIVPSMLQLKHVRANTEAINANRFTADDVNRIQRYLLGLSR